MYPASALAAGQASEARGPKPRALRRHQDVGASPPAGTCPSWLLGTAGAVALLPQFCRRGPPRPVSCQIRCPRTVGGPGASSRGRDVLAPLPAGQPALGECERISGAQGALKPGGGGALSITHPQTGCDSSCVWLPPRGTRRAGWGHLVSFIGQMSGTQTWHPNRGLSSDPGSATYSLCDLHNLPEPQLPHL